GELTVPGGEVSEARFDADYLRNPAPHYPPVSRRRGEQGEVRLQVWVGADGSAERVTVHLSSGFSRLDQAAVRAVSEWRFVPARQGGRAVPAQVIVPVVFRLGN
ncbi:energy transducer TonB, partial [Arthrospira platensis SPKY2]